MRITLGIGKKCLPFLIYYVEKVSPCNPLQRIMAAGHTSFFVTNCNHEILFFAFDFCLHSIPIRTQLHATYTYACDIDQNINLVIFCRRKYCAHLLNIYYYSTHIFLQNKRVALLFGCEFKFKPHQIQA